MVNPSSPTGPLARTRLKKHARVHRESRLRTKNSALMMRATRLEPAVHGQMMAIVMGEVRSVSDLGHLGGRVDAQIEAVDFKLSKHRVPSFHSRSRLITDSSGG
jgi:hypothetical protein